MRVLITFALALFTSGCAAGIEPSPAVDLTSRSLLLDDTEGYTPRSTLALTDSDVVWIVQGFSAVYTSAGQLKRIPKAGGAPTVVADAQPFPIDLALNGDTPYWTNLGKNVNGSLQDGAVETVYPGQMPTALVGDDCDLGAIAVGSGADGRPVVYWVSCWGIQTGSLDGPFNPTKIYPATGSSVAVDETQLYWADDSGAIVTGPKEGGSVTALTPALDCGAGGSIVVDASNVYWLDGCYNVNKVAKTGGAVKVLAANPDPDPFDLRPCGLHCLAVDETRVYWWEPGEIDAVSKDGGEPFTLALEPPFPNAGPSYGGGIAVDATSVYWTDSNGLWRAPKP